MEEFDDTQDKIEAVRRHFAPLIGKKLSAFESAQMEFEGEWDHCFNLPIRLYFAEGALVSVVWSHLDKLWISADKSLNFEPYGFGVRWVLNRVDDIEDAISGTLKSVSLGQGDLSINNKPVEIWTRLLLEQDNGWLEIFNNLDENAFFFHRAKPTGKFISCC